MDKFNPNSTQQLSTLLFGGEISYDDTEIMLDETGEPLVFKSGARIGQLRTKKVKVTKLIEGLQVQPENDWWNEENTKLSTKKSVLQLIHLSAEEGSDTQKIVNLILETRQLEKLINTYYDGVLEVTYDDDTVHPHFSHAGTVTGRLSCSKPNMQNAPSSNKIVKEHFISRFENGKIIDNDYKGIEPRCEAQLCGDPRSIQDILENIDVHTNYLSLKLDKPYEECVALVEDGTLKEARRKVKGFTFSIQYGAGDKTAAKNSGMTIEEVQDLKERRREAYPKLHRYYQWLNDKVRKDGWYKDPWGRRYKFKKYPTPEWRQKQGVMMDYSPTEIQNYRTQGFATATIIPIMLGKFWREKAIYNRDKYLLVNTVHDSIVVDCKEEYLEMLKKDLKLLEEVGIVSKQEFNYDFNVPIECSIEVGENWGKC